MKRLQMRIVMLATSVLVLSALLLSWLTLRDFERGLPPEMARTVSAVGYSAIHVIDKAQQFGVPLAEMQGAETFLDSIRHDNPSIAYILLSDQRGSVLYRSAETGLGQLPGVDGLAATNLQTVRAGDFFNTAMPLVFRGQRIGTLHLGQRTSLAEQQMTEVAYDVVTVLVVASLAAVELLRFVLTFAIATPADAMREFLERVRSGDFSQYLPYDRLGGIGQLSARFNAVVARLNRAYQDLLTQAGTGMSPRLAARLGRFRFHAAGSHPVLHASALEHIRWPFFLLIFADSLSLSFFPVFVGGFYSESMGLSRSVVVGLPISIFMFVWALSMPWAGMWSDRVGHRRAFAVGAAVTTAGLVLTACSQTLYDLLLWRSITALGYGLVFITAQGYVAKTTPPTQRTRGMAVFLSSFFAGSLSGSAIGGILSDRLGFESTILLSAFLSATAAWFVWHFLAPVGEAAAAQPAPRKLSLGDIRLLLSNKKFAAITFLSAVPAKMALTGFLYYSVPLYLKLQGNSPSTTGRAMMAYGLAIIALSPFAAKLADRIGRLRWFVTVGGFAAALAMWVIYYFDSLAGMLVSISLLGIAHAIGVSPQLALINDFCKDVVAEVGVGTAAGIFRLIERLGNVTGPIVAAMLIANFGFNGAFLGIGIICFICVSCFTLMFLLMDRRAARTALRT